MSYNESLNHNSNYPSMSQSEWDNSPMTETEPEEREFNIMCSQTLSKTNVVFTNNYIPVVEEEYDDMGGWHQEYPDTSDTNWSDEYADNDHYTPLQLIELFKKHLEDELSSGELSQSKVNNYKYIIEECNNWSEDETTFVEE